MHALIDADILRYEVGYAAETGWQAEGIPSWDYVQEVLEERLQRIIHGSGATSSTLYLTEGHTFRYDIATVKPYKGTRKDVKPWHYNNLSVYMKDVLGAEVVTGIEADDAMAIEQVKNAKEMSYDANDWFSDDVREPTIICTRDKDLRQVPGWHYSWEMYNQPEWGPFFVDGERHDLELNEKRNKVKGTGLSFFYSQLITGDTVDNIPGLPGKGAVVAHDALNECADQLECVKEMYEEHYGSEWEERMLEQGQLLWMVRRLHNADGSPLTWEIGMIE